MNCLLSRMGWKRFIIFIVMTALAAPLILVDELPAKRKKRRNNPPPLKILDISTSPIPYAPGDKPLAITIDVGLPKNLSGVDLLEVSSTISFPSKRSIRFLYNRLPLDEVVNSSGKSKISTTLLWDGKDQTKQLVKPGIYKYEVRAKLMTYSDGPPLTKIASLRTRGELEVSEPESLGSREPNLEHVPLTSGQNLAEDAVGGRVKINGNNGQKSESGNMATQDENVEEIISENANSSDVSTSPQVN